MEKKQLDGDQVFVIRDFLTPEACVSFVERSEQAGYEEATITTISGRKYVLRTDVMYSAPTE